MSKQELLSKAKPILFNREMVRAILDGRKTVTRRVVRLTPDEHLTTGENASELLAAACAPYRPGDILYVKETWYYESFYEDTDVEPDLPSGNRSWRYVYKASNPDYPVKPGQWHSSIYMPKEAARIFLKVTDIRVERLQDITMDEVIREGINWQDVVPFVPASEGMSDDVVAREQEYQEIKSIAEHFGTLWNRTVKKGTEIFYSWDANPLVWVIEFERVDVDE